MSERDESPSGQIPIEPLATHTETRLKPRQGAAETPEIAGAPAAPLKDTAPISGEKNRTTLTEIEGAVAGQPPVSRRLVLIPEGDTDADTDTGSALPFGEEEPSRPSMAEADELVGQLVDARYRIESVLGIGSMGIVYVARHLAVGKRVALKVLRQQFMQDAEVTQRFASEAS
jgi:hypothetical protein